MPKPRVTDWHPYTASRFHHGGTCCDCGTTQMSDDCRGWWKRYLTKDRRTDVRCPRCALKAGLSTPAISLFRLGDFRLHSGSRSAFKIDCDALTDADWSAVATLIPERIGKFGAAIGVARGGLKFAAALALLASGGEYPLLIVDDVLTTGRSMEEARACALYERPDRDVLGCVVFARGGSIPSWITALFTLQMPRAF